MSSLVSAILTITVDAATQILRAVISAKTKS